MTSLKRALTMRDAVVVGLSSMLGAGVFVAFGPATQAAGGAVLLGLALAGIIAWCNATSTAQLAAAYPSSGGAYRYGRERLGPWPGFLAGWCFIIGKTASCAAMALTFATYVAPPQGYWRATVAILAIVALTALNYRGITRTARMASLLLVVTLLALLTSVVTVWISTPTLPRLQLPPAGTWSWGGVMQSAGLLFFAFAGYARLATLGEEVQNPKQVIPRAITTSLVIAFLIYGVVGVTLLAALGSPTLAASSAPVADALVAADARPLVWVARVGAAVASLGALLALIAGISRTVYAMAENSDVPSGLSTLHPKYAVPHRADCVIACAAIAVVLVADVRSAIAFSSFGVLLYYLIANVSAFTQPASDRLWPRGLQLLGAVGCVALVATLPLRSVAIGAAVIVVGVVARLVLRRRPPGRLATDSTSS